MKTQLAIKCCPIENAEFDGCPRAIISSITVTSGPFLGKNDAHSEFVMISRNFTPRSRCQ